MGAMTGALTWGMLLFPGSLLARLLHGNQTVSDWRGLRQMVFPSHDLRCHSLPSFIKEITMDPMTGSRTIITDTPRPKHAEGMAETAHQITDRMARKAKPNVNRLHGSAHRAVDAR